ncbi:MAG: hypothetical protein ACFCD0_05940 [Gemmataceae bacterium]
MTKPQIIDSADTAPRLPKPRSWIWFFVVIVVLVATAITTLIIYNVNQLLTREDVEAGLARWKEKGPSSYVMYFKVRRIGDIVEPVPLTTPGEYQVKVVDDEVKYVSRDFVALPPETYKHFGMEAIYENLILSNLQEDEKKDAPSTFTRGIFHHTDGHVQWYVRRVSRTRNRVELIMNDFRNRDNSD